MERINNMRLFLEKVQILLFQLGSYFDGITIFDKFGNKIQDYRTWKYNL